jgi:hypothetical protein
MVDFGELKDKAQDLVAQHSDTVKQGITKAGDFVGGKVGHDKVNPIEDKLHDLVDKAAGKDDQVPPPAAPPAPPVV